MLPAASPINSFMIEIHVFHLSLIKQKSDPVMWDVFYDQDSVFSLPFLNSAPEGR